MAWQVKDPVLSLQWLSLLLWHRFDPWPENFHMLEAQTEIYIYIGKRKRQKTQISKIKNENGDITTELNKDNISIHEDTGSTITCQQIR